MHHAMQNVNANQCNNKSILLYIYLPVRMTGAVDVRMTEAVDVRMTGAVDDVTSTAMAAKGTVV
jgi:hypothetical protein